MTERWLPVVGYEGIYEVSDLGQVRGLKGCCQWKPGRILKPYRKTNGYLTVCLYRDRHPMYLTIHRLVADAFLGARPAGHNVNHLNRLRDDNRAVNLQYVTPSENVRHGNRLRVLQEREQKGRRGFVRLTEEDVREIRRLYPTLGRKETARRFGITPNYASRIAAGRGAWLHVK